RGDTWSARHGRSELASERLASGRESVVAQQVLGIDIGGTGIKGAPVDVERGTLTADRYRLLTPQPAVPASVADVVAQVVAKFGGDGVVGATFPAVVRGGVAETAANVDKSWIGEDVARRRGKEVEKRASEIVRENKKLSWKKWGSRVDEYLRHVEMLFSPDLFIIGGGISKKATKFFGYLKTHAPIVPAQLLNEAGIVGAAV